MWANVGDYNSKILRHNHIDHFATDLFKQRGVSGSFYLKKPKKKRPGIHAKSKSSNLKTSKNYVKKYKGQGK